MRRFFLAVLFLTATTAVAQDYDRLVGNWDVSYDDAILGVPAGQDITVPFHLEAPAQ